MHKRWFRRILIMIGISVGSFIGFYFAFIVGAFITHLFIRILGPIGQTIGRLLYLILTYSMFFMTKPLHTPTWFKAILFAIPMISTLIIISLYRYNISLIFTLSLMSLFIGAIGYFILKNRWEWPYMYSLIFVSICAYYVLLKGLII